MHGVSAEFNWPCIRESVSGGTFIDINLIRRLLYLSVNFILACLEVIVVANSVC